MGDECIGNGVGCAGFMDCCERKNVAKWNKENLLCTLRALYLYDVIF